MLLKKIGALLLALTLALGCAAAFAEEANEDAFMMLGFVEGIDGEAMTVRDEKGQTYTLNFTEAFPRAAMDEAIEADSAVSLTFYGGFDGSLTGDILDARLAQNDITGVVAGIDGEAMTVTDADGATHTFYFGGTLLRTDLPETLAAGSRVRVAYDGDTLETTLFAAYALA